jgi:hypothetical protein
MDNEKIDPENEIIKNDSINKLYQLFETIEETVVYDYKKICSYKTIRDDNNVFIMINRELLQNILGKIPQPERIRIKTV